MTIDLNLPPEIAKQIGEKEQRAALEAVLVEMYRQEKIVRGQLSERLGLSWHETEELLYRYRVTEDMITLEELKEELAAVREGVLHAGRQ